MPKKQIARIEKYCGPASTIGATSILVGSLQQDVEMKEEEAVSAGQETWAGAEPMQGMATDEPENENIQPAEISPEEQIEILMARIKDLD